MSKLKTKMYPRKTEKVNDRVRRLRVLGGWLVWMIDSNGSTSHYIDDPDEEWVLEPGDPADPFQW